MMRFLLSSASLSLALVLGVAGGAIMMPEGAIAQSVTTIQTDEAEAQRLVKLAEGFDKAKDYDRAIEAYQKAQTLYQKTNNFLKEGYILVFIGNLYSSQARSAITMGDYSKAIRMVELELSILQKGVEISRKTPDRYLRMIMLQKIGISYTGLGTYLNSNGQYNRALQEAEKALPHLKESLAIAQSLKDDQQIESSWNAIFGSRHGLVGIYRNLEQPEAALLQIQQLKEIVASTKNPKNERYLLESELGAYISLATQLDRPDLYDKYIEVNQKVIVLSRQLDDIEKELGAQNNIASVLSFRGQYSQSLEIYKQILPRARQIQDVTREILALQRIGGIYLDQANYGQALDIYQEALRTSRKHRQSMMERTALNNIATIHNYRGEYSSAISIYQKNLDFDKSYYEQLSQGATLENIQAICIESLYLKKNCDNLVKLPVGFELDNFKKLIVTAVQVSGMRISTSLANIASIEQSRGNYPKALDLYQEALLISRKHGNPDREAINLGSIALVHIEKGDYSNALRFTQQALTAAKDNPTIFSSMRSRLALIARDQGDYKTALSIYQQLLTVVKETGRRSDEATVFDRIASVYHAQGAYASALENYQQALKIRRKIGVIDKVADTLVALGTLQRDLGQPDLALTVHRESLEIARKIGSQPQIMAALLAIASDYRIQGKNDQALTYYKQALTISQATGQLSSKSDALSGIGQVYSKQLKSTEALNALQQALVIQQQIGVQPKIAKTLSLIGQAQTQLNHPEASTTLQTSIALSQQIGDRPTTAQALANLANLHSKTQPQLAITLYKQAVIHYEAIRKGLAPLPRDQQESYTKTVSTTYRNLADLLIQQNRLLEAQQILDLLKLQEIKDYATPTRSTLQTAEVTLNQTEQEIAKRHGTVIAFRQKLDQCKGKINNSDCDKLDNESTQQAKALNQFLTTLEAEVDRRCQTDKAKDCLRPDDKFTTAANRLITAQPGSLVILPVVLDSKIWILVISEGGLITRYESNIDRLTLGKKVLELRQHLDSPHSDLKALQATSQQLYDWLIRPIEPQLKSSKTPPKLIFALDRVTRYIPMGVLHDGQQYLTQRYPISTILSIASTNADKSTIADIPNTKVLALGASQASANYRALPAVQPELASIIQSTGIYPGKILLNSDFTRSNFKNNLDNIKILHIATHGKFEPTQIKGSFLVLGNGEELPIDDIQTFNFTDLDLVVLSACQTALGNPEQEGIEIPGISSYFLSKGAKSVIASLWGVDDSSTAILMQQLYRHLSTGKSKTEALRQAQLDLLNIQDTPTQTRALQSLPRIQGLEKTRLKATTNKPIAPGYTHPYYWAPFILIGNSL